MPSPDAGAPGSGPRRVAVVPDPPSPADDGDRRRARQARAGRNLPAAVAVGTALGVLVALALFVRKEAFVLLTAAAIVLALWELANAFRARRIRIPVVPVVVGGVGMLVSAFLAGPEALFVTFALTAFSSLLWRVLDGPNPVRDVTAGVFTAAYVPFLAGFALLMLAEDDGPYRVLAFLMVAIGSDIGGYAFGSVWGRHPLAPNVSPKKSWEGLLGSTVFAVVLGVLGVVLGLGGSWWAGVLLGVVVVVTATVGDLSESLLKRDLGIKDMGSLLPGHGGIMDRLDSLLPAAPVAWVLLALIVPVA
ncbi:phosphatidate cytidylyltransferase [Aquipuribacter sp. SD81]|uniref:phosphatidate cytidylyltransferase n=1 Tax=Aquipuribacter sp. SD81 TaxID=3127703 RepID=UPI00301A970D